MYTAFPNKLVLTAGSDRVKSVDLHPTEPWMLASLYNDSVCVWNHETQVEIFKDFIRNTVLDCLQ